MSERFVRRAISVAAFCIPFVVYLISVEPSVGFWDTAEMQTVPYILGIAHPTGFPLFVLLGHVFSHVVVIGNVAWRISMMSAITMAAAAWFVFAALRDEGIENGIAMLCAWTFAFGAVAWTRGTRAEVHSLAILLIGASIWAALRVRATGELKWLCACALCVGLAVATHPVVIWALPGLAVLLFWPAEAHRRYAASKVLLAVASALAPLLLYLYIPLRSAYVAAHALDPTLTLGLPAGQAFWDWGHPASWHNFALLVSGAYYAKNGALAAILQPFGYPVFARALADKVPHEFAALGVLLILVGFARLVIVDRPKALAFALIALAGVPFAISYTVESDYDRYLLTCYWMLALVMGYGAQTAVTLCTKRISAFAAAVLVALLLAINLGYLVYDGRETFAQPHDRSADAFIDRVALKTRDGAAIVASWVYAAPLAYGSYVEHRLGRRIIVSAEPEQLATPIQAWMRKRAVYALYFHPLGDTTTALGRMHLTAVDNDSPPIYRVVADGKQ
ncbi:MAG: DUF2723 domain-containing protein [Candidatus Eremiobacteraeota bacterium]|nr:DUF2723 domain-containing protein [Candidatus Eremiobacteraeota bacterium]